MDCDRLVFAEFAAVVVEFGEAEDVLGDLLQVCFPVLNLNADWLGNFGAVVCAQARFKTCAPEEA